MSRKQYEILAKRLAVLYGQLEVPDAYDPLKSFNEFFDGLCEDLKQDNPNFSKAKFTEAVYLE